MWPNMFDQTWFLFRMFPVLCFFFHFFLICLRFQHHLTSKNPREQQSRCPWLADDHTKLPKLGVWTSQFFQRGTQALAKALRPHWNSQGHLFKTAAMICKYMLILMFFCLYGTFQDVQDCSRHVFYHVTLIFIWPHHPCSSQAFLPEFDRRKRPWEAACPSESQDHLHLTSANAIAEVVNGHTIGTPMGKPWHVWGQNLLGALAHWRRSAEANACLRGWPGCSGDTPDSLVVWRGPKVEMRGELHKTNEENHRKPKTKINSR